MEPAELSLNLAKMTSEMQNTLQVLFAREVARCATCSHTKLQEFSAFMFQHLLLLFGISGLECVKWALQILGHIHTNLTADPPGPFGWMNLTRNFRCDQIIWDGS